MIESGKFKQPIVYLYWSDKKNEWSEQMKIHVEEKTSDENPKGISISQDQNSEKRGFALQHPLENDRNT